MSNNINVFIIRHGETLINRSDQIGQASDTKLTDVGIEQATKLGKRFAASKIEFDRVCSSTYDRALATAAIFAKLVDYKGSMVVSSDLREYNAGKWIGRKRSEVYSDPANTIKMLSHGMGFRFPGKSGESYEQVYRRSSAWLEEAIIHNDDVLKIAEMKPVNVAVFTHGQTAKAILKYVMGYDSGFLWRISIDNTGVCHLIYNAEKGWFLKSINDTAHLMSFNKS